MSTLIRRSAAAPALVFARGIVVLLVLVLGPAACATSAPSARTGEGAPAFSFATDTFAFPNQIRARTPSSPDLYANYCFVLARAVRQVFTFARFDPSAPRLDSAGYVDRLRDVLSRPAWQPALPGSTRVVIPGYPDLRSLSRAEERAVKDALGGRFWTWVHWTNWRVTFPVSRAQQATVASETASELRAGRLVQLLVTNWPKPELNHTVVAYDVRERPEAIEFTVWDPNDPDTPGTVTFDLAERRFEATRLYDTERGPIRAFRMHYSRWL